MKKNVPLADIGMVLLTAGVLEVPSVSSDSKLRQHDSYDKAVAGSMPF